MLCGKEEAEGKNMEQHKHSPIRTLKQKGDARCPNRLPPALSIFINRLISPILRIGQHVGPELRHLAVVAILAGVSQKNAAGVVLRRPQLV
jgi:hypothetical protein